MTGPGFFMGGQTPPSPGISGNCRRFFSGGGIPPDILGSEALLGRHCQIYIVTGTC